MLTLIYHMKDLNFRQLMDVYEEGNLENGRQMFPYEPEGQWPLLAEQSFYQYLKECFFPTKGAAYAVWTAQGRYVSALRLEPYRDGLLIEALETAPAMRRQGYASALLLAVKNWAGDQTLYSHVSKKNLPSLQTHLSCGFHRIMEHAVYADGSVLTNCCTFCSRE